MEKIVAIKQAITLSKTTREGGKKVVLAGGCFDILHLGHVLFLQKAKSKGDALFVLVENDRVIKNRKGEQRPIHTQKERALVLAALTCVDAVILLPYFTRDKQYDSLVKRIKPAIIAATKGDTEIVHKKRSAKLAGATVVYVTKRVGNKSSSRLAALVAREE